MYVGTDNSIEIFDCSPECNDDNSWANTTWKCEYNYDLKDPSNLDIRVSHKGSIATNEPALKISISKKFVVYSTLKMIAVLNNSGTYVEYCRIKLNETKEAAAAET